MLRKILEIILIFLALAAFAALSAVLSLKLIFPESKLKKLCYDGIRGYTSREANFASIKWGLNGISIEGVSVSVKPGFEQGTFLTANRINYKPVFMPGKASGLLTVDTPNVLVEYFPEGFGLRVSSDAQQVFNNTDAGMHYLPFSGLNIINGGVSFKNKKTGRQDIVIKKIRLTLNKGGARGVFEGAFSADVSLGSVNLDISGDISIDYKAQTAQLSNAKIQAGQFGSLDVSGRIKEFASPENIEYDLNVKGDRRSLDKVFELLPGNLSNVQYGTRQKIDLNILAGAGKFKVRDNLYGR
jgi:hypothetical protein